MGRDIGDLRSDQGNQGQVHRHEAIAFLANWKTANSPKGPVAVDPATRDIIQNIYLRRTEMKDGKLANIEFDTIPNVKDPWKELNPPKRSAGRWITPFLGAAGESSSSLRQA
jgi:hypothetical protein